MLQAEPRPTSQVLSFRTLAHGLEITTARERLFLEPVADAIVRVSATLDTAGPPSLERMSLEASPRWSVEEGNDLRLVLDGLVVRVVRATGRLVFERPDGTPWLEEADRDPRVLEGFDSMQTDFEQSRAEKVKTPDGWKDVMAEPKRVFRKRLTRARFSWKWGDEALYGLGQHDTGVLNLRGTRLYVHQANRKIALPLLVSSRGWGLLFDTGAPLVFSDDEHGSYVLLEAVQEPAYYFIGGSNLDDVVAGYRSLTGRASLLPAWCFGYLQCQERYESQQELLEVAREYRARNLPLDALILDWMSWPDGHWGQKSFDPGRFPDPAGMIQSLHAQGIRFMISIWPMLDPKADDHRELRERGHLFPLSDIYNAFSPEARRAYWEQTERGLFRHGVDAWWCDSAEPFTPEWNLIERPEPDRLHREYLETSRVWMDEEQTNAYGLFHAWAIAEGQRAAAPDQRVVNLTRSGWAGQQRYGAILWSGDTSASWKTLRDQIPAGLGFTAAGMPYWTVDIGAFFVKRGKNWFWDGEFEEGNGDPAYRELYLRWFQWAAFLPIFRAHGTDTRREIWAFGEPGEVVYDTLVRFLRLRYSLLPYLYSLAGAVTHRHATLMRLLAFDFPHDPDARECRDQFLLGRALLVCPVVAPLTEAAHRTVLLPQGADWWDYWHGVRYPGGQSVVVKVDLETIPLFVRAGSLLPLAEPAESTAAWAQNRVLLSVYPGADGSFDLYEDDGLSTAAEAGQCSFLPLAWSEERQELTLGARQGEWPGLPASKEFRVQVAGREGERVVIYTGAELRVRLS